MKAVGEYRDRPRRVAEAELRDRDNQVKDENSAENAYDALIAIA
jgi:hypothetical protein